MYDPLIGRFLNADPYVQMPDLSQNYNRYTYCLNNPLKFTDPSGYRLAGPEYDSSIDAINAYLGFMADVSGAWHLPSGGGGGSRGYYFSCGNYYDRKSGVVVKWNEVHENYVVPYSSDPITTLFFCGTTSSPYSELIGVGFKNGRQLYFGHNTSRGLANSPQSTSSEYFKFNDANGTVDIKLSDGNYKTMTQNELFGIPDYIGGMAPTSGIKGNAKLWIQLEKQLAKDGPKSIIKSLRSIEQRLLEHQIKLPDLKFKSSIEREIQSFEKSIETIKNFLRTNKINP